ncbi:probable ATP-dependent RNA helicase DHX58 [Bufo gargarizans]|uniref:probable ATP-dependent RNA helicase DHX58 n=2 Tax=Bufo gargarizans TaxID=30331 RepID=UPI001CF43E0D|nr:probable ATP-dependent RNA helicase DHX58 [Bufo gargarizans]
MDLRDYQWEVIGPALEGKNTIIWLPTGTGKTRAAVYVAMRHLEIKRNAKVAMIVNKVHLVHQHYSKEFQPYLEDRFKIIPISGESETRSFFANFTKKSDIVICTAQILHNALKSDSEEMHVELTDFSLIIIDECHHTQKDAVYNLLMEVYLEKKFTGHRNLPQILGLTASPGTGGASTFENAVDHILKICANLDTWKIMSPQTSIEDLEAKAKQPVKQYDLVPERDEDPFGDKLKELMATIHEYLGEFEFTRDFGTQMYEQRIVEMEKNGAESADRIRRTCAIHLRKYNDALLLHDTVRMKDAYDFLEEFYIFEKFVKDSRDETDVFLYSLFNDNTNELLELSRNMKYENPKLTRLEEILKEHFQDSSNSQGIIFTRTRQNTHSLLGWINSNDSLKSFNIKAEVLTGAGFSNQSKHMTQNEQKEVIEKFRRGLLNLLISTSVAEEGLDIPQCNIVVRYGLMTNEISMMQARGRARADDSCYSFLAKSGGRESRREMTNECLEDLMKRAIKYVQDMPEREYEDKIKDLQRDSLTERLVKKNKEESKKKFLPSEVRLDCRNCSAAVAYGNDLRVVEESHHVNINPTFKVYYEEYTGPVVLGKKMMDWVPGSAIRCRFCKAHWGLIMIYRGLTTLPIISIKNFVIKTPESYKTCKKWKDVPFPLERFKYNEYFEEHQSDTEDD